MWERKEYTSDLTDAEWTIIEPLLPKEKPVGRLREVDLREVLNAINYRADNGVKWRNLPSEFPAWQTVYGYFRSWVRQGVWESINAALVAFRSRWPTWIPPLFMWMGSTLLKGTPPRKRVQFTSPMAIPEIIART